jgi:RecA-family ATPase
VVANNQPWSEVFAAADRTELSSMSVIDPQSLARALGGEARGNEISAPGPGHTAEDRSLSVKVDPGAPDGLLVHSHSPRNDWQECRDYVREKAGLGPFTPNGQGHKHHSAARRPQGSVEATYDYRDESGVLRYQVVRLKPKSFRQRRPDGNGGWIPNLEGVRRVLYRLPEILRYPHGTVFVCEGEKDADRVASLEHCATTVASGKWTDDCVKALAGRHVIILQDNDDAGAKKASAAAQALHSVATTIRIVLLPDLPAGGDISDWLNADPQRDGEMLARVCMDAPEWTPTAIPDEAEKQPLSWLDMSKWDSEPVPARKWAIPDRVPLNQAGLFSGEGGTGKSIIELTKNVAHVLGKDWLGSLPEIGPAFYLGAEDDADELHIRLAAIAAHYGATFKELIEGGLHVLCLLGQDATLCAADGKSGKVETTALYKQIYEAAGDIKPKNISIDTLSRAFAGNEIDRVQVYGFANHMQALAKVAGGSVTVLSHPSLHGIQNGSGISGSTAWHGAFRFRQYLKGVKQEGGEQPDNDLRELEFKKNQYGPIAETIVLRYQRGLFLPEAGLSSLDKLAREQKAEETFLALLARYDREGRNASDKPTSPTYAPTLFCKERDANGVRKEDLAAAMRRLFEGGKIHVENYGRPSRPASRLRLGKKEESSREGGQVSG